MNAAGKPVSNKSFCRFPTASTARSVPAWNSLTSTRIHPSLTRVDK